MLLTGLPALPAASARIIIVAHTVLLIGVLLLPEWLARREPRVELPNLTPLVALLWILVIAGALRGWLGAA